MAALSTATHVRARCSRVWTPWTALASMLVVVLTGGLVASRAAAERPQVELDERGLVFSFGKEGSALLAWPELRVRADKREAEKPRASTVEGTPAISYASGAKVRAARSGEHAVTYAVSELPAGSPALVFTIKVPVGFRLGGEYGMDGAPLQPFPERAEKQILSQKQARSFTIFAPSGKGVRVTTPAGFHQIQDSRWFGGSSFLFIYHHLFKAPARSSKLTFSYELLERASARSASGGFLVDRYGQSSRREFPSKVKRDRDLTEDIAEEKRLFERREDPAQRDVYGGLAGSGKRLGLQRTGFFHVQRAGGRELLVTPEGNAFFQLGVCGINITDDYTLVKGREELYEWLPPSEGPFAAAWRPNTPGVVSFYIANWIRKYGAPFDLERWSEQVVKRVRLWGFNSGGAFSAQTAAMKALDFPVTELLPMSRRDGIKTLPGRVGGGEVLDPFAPGSEEALRTAFAKKLTPKVSDPRVIGYFFGNEQHFELLPKLIPTYKASQVAAKAKLVEALRDKYATIERFNAAWQPSTPFSSFEQLGEAPLVVQSESAAADMRAFQRVFLEAHFSLVERVFRAYDPNHLLLGNRLTPATANDRDVVEISGRYVDVLSTNYYSYQVERPFLEQVHAWSGRPVLLSEWYFGTSERGLGGGKEVRDQRERAQAYRNYVEQAAALPFVVGTQWFIFNDQSVTGRFFGGFNGEANNTGLVDVADQPYRELLMATRETGARIYDVMMGLRPPFALRDPRFDGTRDSGPAKVVLIPRASERPLHLDGTSHGWPSTPAESIEASRTMVGTADPQLRAQFRLCWDEEHLYFMAQVRDATPGRNQRQGALLWQGDAVELFVGARELGRKGQLLFDDRQVLLGAAGSTQVHVNGSERSAAAVRTFVGNDVASDGYVLEAAIPWAALDVIPKPGTELLFDVAIDNSEDGLSRRQQLVWNGNARNSSDRGVWGRARIVQN